MNPRAITSVWIRAALVLLCVMWTVSGWTLITTGSFSTRPIRSTITTTVEGAGATFMGAIFLELGLIALLLVLQSLAARRKLQVLTSILLLGLPPLVIALAR